MTMCRRFCVLVALSSLVGAAVAQTATVNHVLEMSEFVRDWQISKQFTVDVAKAMPRGTLHL